MDSMGVFVCAMILMGHNFGKNEGTKEDLEDGESQEIEMIMHKIFK